METAKSHENYPISIVIISNLHLIFVYGLGFLIMFKSGLFFAIIFLIYISLMEYRVIRYHCINCFYWGKTCGFGKGRISSRLFKKGDMSKFCIKEMSWRDMIPDLLVLLIPLVTGIILLILKFDLIILFAILLLLLLTTTGNSFIRGSMTCKYCKQRELGCPAYLLFNKEK